MIHVVSGFSPSGYATYAEKFLETFDRFWPKSVRLAVYLEEMVPMPRGEARFLWEIEGAREFFERHKDVPAHRGREIGPKWSPKDQRKPYAWRFDAVKWFRQCLIPNAAAESVGDGEILVWLDADVMSLAPVPDRLVQHLLGDADLAYLGRKGAHSEIGFWAVRLSPITREFLREFAEMWTMDAVFEEHQWHSAFIFDVVRERFKEKGLKALNLTPAGRGHVWFMCRELAKVTDHLKGDDRKMRGYSIERGALR